MTKKMIQFAILTNYHFGGIILMGMKTIINNMSKEYKKDA